MSKSARVLLYDLETSPIISYNWGIWEQNAIEVIEDWQILCFAYKWLDEKKIHIVSQDEMKGYKPGKLDDRLVVEQLRDLFDEANVIVAHNGNSFDQKKSQARMMTHKLTPPSSYQQIDTKVVAKRYGAFTSNKLDFLNRTFGFEGKMDAGGFATWKGCLAGDKKSWARMKKYNKKDIIELEKLYLHLRPWMQNHPNMANLQDRPSACPICGKEGFMWAQGIRYTKTGQYRRWQCKDCGAYSSQRKGEKDVAPNFA